MRRTAPLLLLVVLALAGCGLTEHVPPGFSSWGQAANLALNLLTLAAVAALGAVALHFWRRRDDAPDPERLDAQPLLPGETRWLLNHGGTVLDSCSDSEQSGVSSGWAVGHHISEWAPPGTPEAEHYRAALEDRVIPPPFAKEITGGDGKSRVVEVRLKPRSDGTVYCESWDITAHVRRAEEAEAEVERLTGQKSRLMTFASTDAAQLFEDSRPVGPPVLAEAAPASPSDAR